jgi:Ca-activated chloride channel family protein
MSGEAYAQLPEREEVRVALELQRNARAKRDAVSRLDASDVRGAQQVLRHRQQVFGVVAVSAPAFLWDRELSELADLERNAVQDVNLTRKRATSQNYDRSRSKR